MAKELTSGLRRLFWNAQVSEAVEDRVAEFSAPQLAAICSAFVGLRRGQGHSALLDAIVRQVLRSFKARRIFYSSASMAPVARQGLRLHADNDQPAPALFCGT
jgi:hypothetical protein